MINITINQEQIKELLKVKEVNDRKTPIQNYFNNQVALYKFVCHNWQTGIGN